MAPKIPERLYTLHDLSRLTSTHEATLRRAIRAGRLDCIRLGRLIRVTPLQVEAYLCGGDR